MRHVWVPCLLLLLVACREKAPVDGAIRVAVRYGSYTPACLRVRVQDGQGHEGRTDIPKSQFKNTEAKQILVAVFRQPDWARELTLEVSSYDGSSGDACSGTLVEQHSPPAPITVPLGEFTPYDVTLQAQDGDGDTFIKKEAGVAGTDCDDSDGAIHPGATELCNPQVDYDCDDAKGCQDSQCTDKPCDDGDACTTGEHCQGSGAAATCSGGTTKQCNPPGGPCFTGSTCDSRTGECVDQKAPPDTLCDDGKPCTVNDQCGPQASCAGTPKSCNTASACLDTPGTCNLSTGACEYTPKGSSTNCDDSDACTTQDLCNGSGACQGVPTPCTATSPCFRVTGGCTALNNCTQEPDPSKVNASCTLPGGGTGVCRTGDGTCSTFPYLPSNFDPDTISTASIGALNITCAVTFDSGAQTWSPSNCVTNPPTPIVKTAGGIEMLVLPVSSFNLGADLRLVGSRSVILAVYGDATVSHYILANGIISGTNPVPGAGSNQNCTTVHGQDGTLANGAGGGGGGAGGATAGAAGMPGSEAGSTAGPAGSVGLSNFVPLAGGCPGGNGGGNTNSQGKGGAGGGAIQLSVARTLTVSQRISASGGGGFGGNVASNQAGGGGGGGSGGQIVLEAYQLNLNNGAVLTANGGGGGEGAAFLGISTRDGNNGEDGSASAAAQASGGTGSSMSGGDGGKGGGGSQGPGTAEAGTSVNGATGGGGGGGGSVGHIRVRAVQACSINGSAVISPPANNLCPP